MESDINAFSTDQLIDALLTRAEAGVVLLILESNADDHGDACSVVTQRRWLGNKHTLLGLLVDGGQVMQKELDADRDLDEDDEDDEEPWLESLNDE